MMSQCFPNNLALVSCAYEIPFCISMVVGSAAGGYLYEIFGLFAPMNLCSEYTIVLYD